MQRPPRGNGEANKETLRNPNIEAIETTFNLVDASIRMDTTLLTKPIEMPVFRATIISKYFFRIAEEFNAVSRFLARFRFALGR